MDILKSYTNGNCLVTLFSDGTKIREYDNEAIPFFPDSIDCKITNFCDAKCQFCHEQSTVKGKHGDIDFLRKTLGALPAGVELAIGGGNPLSYPDLDTLLEFLKDKGIIANITVNAFHLKSSTDRINHLRKNKLAYGIGISYNSKYHEDVVNAVDDNTVIHVISGVNTLTEVMNFPKQWKLLVLGYKNYGFGEKYKRSNPVDKNINKWRFYIGSLMKKFHVSFDNLAIRQLNIKNYIDEKTWNEMYMGDDGQFTMYIDGVEKTYAKSSTSKRIDAGNLNAQEMFAEVRKNKDLLSII